jgi:hypothetical protein
VWRKPYRITIDASKHQPDRVTAHAERQPIDGLAGPVRHQDLDPGGTPTCDREWT